jgi:translation initiation factor 2 gamma subunit (eIF-2gamma)
MTNFVLLGNVDNGKSTLAGRIIIQTQNIDPNEVEKARRESEKNGKASFWLAYLLDIDESERSRGITLGYTFFDIKYKERDFKIIDVPGHHNLVQEMISGSSHADIAILVLSARTGEYESSLKGQALQHTLIARGIGIQHLIVAINKIDTIYNSDDVDFKIDEIKKDFSQRIKKFKFKTVEFIPISAYNGIGIDRLLDSIASIKIEDKKDKMFQVNDNSIIKTKMMFDLIPNLISVGFKCIAHSKDIYFNVELVDIRNDKKSWITKNDIGKLIDVDIKILDSIEQITSNLIIRLSDVTIGLARVVNVN